MAMTTASVRFRGGVVMVRFRVRVSMVSIRVSVTVSVDLVTILSYKFGAVIWRIIIMPRIRRYTYFNVFVRGH